MGKHTEKETATIMIYGCICGWKADKVQLAKQRYNVIVKQSNLSSNDLAEHDNYLSMLVDERTDWKPVIAFHGKQSVMYLKELI